MTLGERLYRLALLAYPRAFRQRYADDMVQHFRGRRMALVEGAPVRGRLRLALEMGADLIASVPRQHRLARSTPPRAGQRGMARAPRGDERDGSPREPGAAHGAGGPGRSRRKPSSIGMGPSSPQHRDPIAASTLGDLRYAARSLLRQPGFTLTVILTLALGIGASTAVYTLVDGVLLEPLPYRQPDRLVQVLQQSERYTIGMSVVEYLAVRDQAGSGLESVAAVVHSRQAHAGGPPLPSRVVVTGGERPESVSAAWVAGRLFDMLGVPLAQGRGFRPGEDEPGAAGVVVVSDAFATRFFGSAAAATGRPLTLEGRGFTVIGVLPPGVGEIAGIRAEVWPQFHVIPPGRRGPFYLRVFGRLEEGVGLAGVAAELGGISERIFPVWSAGFQDRTARMTARPLREAIVGDVGPVLLLVGGAVMLVLLITVANVAGLTLSRAVGRRREIAIRTALGAGRIRLARLVLAENLALAAAGGLAGIGLAGLGIEALRRLGPVLPRLDEVGLDAGVAGFAAAAACLAGLLVGASPLALLLASRGRPDHDGRGASQGRTARRLRSALVVGEFALTVPLLIASVLLLSSLVNLQSADPGFDPAGALAVSIALPPDTSDVPAALRFWAEAESLAAEVPGVTAAGLSTGLPPDAPAHFNNFDLVDRPVEPGAAQPVAPWSTVTPGFFDALGVPLLEGRGFRATDDADGMPVVIVTRAWAERFYPAESAVGRRMISGGCTSCEPQTVIGVVGDVKYRGMGGDGEAIYAPLAQEVAGHMYLVVRASRPVEEIVPELRGALVELDPELPFEPVTMNERLADSVAGPRHWTTLVGSFGLAAVLLAAVGIFGLLSYVVDRERRELGVRMALGASGGDVVALVLRRGLALAASGIVAGLAASLLLGRFLDGLLFGVTATDPATWIGVVALLLLVTLGACYLPGRRAAGIEPSRALSSE